MLKSWKLSHFKSIYNETNFELAPLTIFAGANSSGKTTFFQSLLLTAQTLQNPVVTRPVILNGHILKLGTFDDVVSNGYSSDDKITIGFNLKPLDGDTDAYSGRYFYFRAEEWESAQIDCYFSFSASGPEEIELLNLYPKLEEFYLKTVYKSKDNSKEDVEDEIHFRKSKKEISEIIEKNNLSEKTVNRSEHIQALQFEVLKPLQSLKQHRYVSYRSSRPSGKTIGVKLRHFLPDEFAIVYETQEYYFTCILAILTGEEDYYMFGDFILNESEIKLNSMFQKYILQIINEVLDDKSRTRIRNERMLNTLETLKENFSIRTLTNFLSNVPPILKKNFTFAFNEKRDELRSTFFNGRKTDYAITYAPKSMVSEAAINYIKYYFSNRVKYLGPLRDEPKAIYPLSGSIDTKDIGFKGEHTAAVLDIHRNTLVQYIPSDQFNSNQFKNTARTVSLSDAVQDWLKYMGVASNYSTSDKGKLGHEMRISTGETNLLHDLTHVGVGVSQVLPILVLALLADRGSTLIFEQPELHLHPRVQTRLADFFASMITLKKQCIVESHSEYLINRLRYWAASSEGDYFSKNVIMYFVEKELDYSVYQTIRMNKYGYIERWPKGFFDEAEETSRKILEAAREKRLKEAKTK